MGETHAYLQTRRNQPCASPCLSRYAYVWTCSHCTGHRSPCTTPTWQSG